MELQFFFKNKSRRKNKITPNKQILGSMEQSKYKSVKKGNTTTNNNLESKEILLFSNKI